MAGVLAVAGLPACHCCCRSINCCWRLICCLAFLLLASMLLPTSFLLLLSFLLLAPMLLLTSFLLLLSVTFLLSLLLLLLLYNTCVYCHGVLVLYSQSGKSSSCYCFLAYDRNLATAADVSETPVVHAATLGPCCWLPSSMLASLLFMRHGFYMDN
jgi:hypothetical protein